MLLGPVARTAGFGGSVWRSYAITGREGTFAFSVSRRTVTSRWLQRADAGIAPLERQLSWSVRTTACAASSPHENHTPRRDYGYGRDRRGVGDRMLASDWGRAARRRLGRVRRPGFEYAPRIRG